MWSRRCRYVTQWLEPKSLRHTLTLLLHLELFYLVLQLQRPILICPNRIEHVGTVPVEELVGQRRQSINMLMHISQRGRGHTRQLPLARVGRLRTVPTSPESVAIFTPLGQVLPQQLDELLLQALRRQSCRIVSGVRLDETGVAEDPRSFQKAGGLDAVLAQ
jgi:hypothetical protein